MTMLFIPYLNHGVLYKLVFANLHVKWDFLIVCPLSAVDAEVIVIIRQTSYDSLPIGEATKRSLNVRQKTERKNNKITRATQIDSVGPPVHHLRVCNMYTTACRGFSMDLYLDSYILYYM